MCGNLTLAGVLEHDLGLVVNRFELHHRDRSLLAGLQYAGKNLLPVESLAPAVFFDDHVWNFINAFVARESALAPEALASPPDRLALLAFARIDHLVMKMAAERTFHNFTTRPLPSGDP